ncbi:MAG: hypothetical protein JW778_03585 [Candidatus Altiarchaeota archaeon]|nr:hypothetical protein [Candidatus Altiarchaeota archaeon]
MTGLFTVDSMWALAVALGIISVSLYLVSTPKISYEEHLYSLSLDVLTVAEKQGHLRKAVDGDPIGVEKMRSSLPDDLCFDLDILDQNNELVFHYGSECEEPKRSSLVKRSVVSNSQFYVASLRMWYNGQ